MRGRDFLAVARDSCRQGTEAHWRTAAGRAYYAAMLEVRDAFTRWGLSVPPPQFVHDVVRRRLYCSRDGDMKMIGQLLDALRALRRLADYQTAPVSQFVSDAQAIAAVRWAENVLSLFDAIDADSPRRTGILAEIRAVLP
jgi:hypothetical protein